jgi:hypothetical protein
MFRENILMMNSSNSRGTIRAPANGQPTIDPRPNHIIPCAIFGPPFKSKNAARPSIDVYMVNVDGRKAVDAWNMPGLNKAIRRNRRPMRGLSVRQIEEYSLVWQAAQKTARTMRIK